MKITEHEYEEALEILSVLLEKEDPRDEPTIAFLCKIVELYERIDPNLQEIK